MKITVQVDAYGNIIPPTKTVEVLKGTEDGHYFTISVSRNGFALGFRNLNENISTEPCGELRARAEGVEGSLVGFLQTLGFTRKEAGHYSAVMSAEKYQQIVDLLG